MPYDTLLAQRIWGVLGSKPDVAERKMFGGLAFLRDGKMFVGIVRDRLMVRVGPEAYLAVLAEPHVHEMDFTGRPMKGYVFVDPPGIVSKVQLQRWVDHSYGFVANLPAKPRKRP